MVGSTNVIGGGRVSLSCTVDRRGGGKAVLGLKCYRGTDISKMVCIEAFGSEGVSYQRTKSPEVILQPHRQRQAWENIIFERFSEKKDVQPVDDFYQNHAARLIDLPPQMSVEKFHSRKDLGSTSTSTVPLVHLFRDKVAYELSIDRKASGIDVFEMIGWSERLGAPRGSRIRIAVVVWAEPSLYPGPYEYHFTLKKLIANDTTTAELLDADGPVALSHQQKVAIGWALIYVRGNLQSLGRHAHSISKSGLPKMLF